MERSPIRVSLPFLLMGAILCKGCSSVETVSDERHGVYDIVVTEIIVKPLDENMSAVELWFSVKALVTNNTTLPRTVMIGIQGVDREGFELKDVILRGSLGANETRFLTDRLYTSKESFQKVVNWRVESVSFTE